MLIVIIEFTMWILNNPTKEEIQKQKENEYIINLNNWIRTIKKELPKNEDYIKQKKLKLRCLEIQDQRIKNNENFEINFCEKTENLKNFNDLTEVKATNYQVALTWLSNNDEKIELNSATDINVTTKVKHKYWREDDDKQNWLNYLYEKSWYDKDILSTFLGENWTFGLERRSFIKWNNWYYDWWICQLNWQYHKKFINSPDFQNPYKQLDYCIWVWNNAKSRWILKTTFYAYNTRYKQESNFLFYN